MAGMPRTRALARALDRRVALTFEDDPESDEPGASHLDYVVLWVESGRTMLDLVRELNSEEGLNIMPSMLGNYLRRYWPDATQRLAEARREGAHLLGERSVEVGNERADTSADVGRLRVKSGALQWLAGGWNRDAYGNGRVNPSVQLNLNVGALHLDALRARSIAVENHSQLADASAPHVLRDRNEPGQPASLTERQVEVEDAQVVD